MVHVARTTHHNAAVTRQNHALSWIGIYPLVYIFAALLGLILPPDFPIFLRLALVTGLVVPAMSYVVGPALTRLFHKWLHAT